MLSGVLVLANGEPSAGRLAASTMLSRTRFTASSAAYQARGEGQ